MNRNDMRNKYQRIILITACLLMVITMRIFTARLKPEQTIVPETPFTANKIMVYKSNIYLLSSSEKAVIAIDKEGKTMGKLGAKGEGPGEFMYISDFTIFQDQFIIGGGKRIQIFSPEGKVSRQIKTKKNVLKVFAAGKHWYYAMTWNSIDKENKKITPLIAISDPDGKVLKTFPDESLQNAYHPLRGNNVPFPWFPSPYSNRLVFVSGTGTKAAVFMTRCSVFFVLQTDQLHSQKITAKLESEDITEQDKQIFFEKIEPKPLEKTKKSVVFPKQREFFLGVIPWDSGWALIKIDSLIILDEQGVYLETIFLPKILIDVIKEVGSPETALFKERELYVIKNFEEVLVFTLK